LPLKLNQWCNVVRWEFKDATPFIRSREFLWQESHTCWANREDAMEEVFDIQGLYGQCYRDLLAVPTIAGYKTEKEKFSGAEVTTTIEGYIPIAGKAIQCATSHCLGQNFSKMFGIQFQDEKGENQFAWQNSWGFTTRSIGVATMIHGDDKGMVYAPKVAPIQVVIIPILFKKGKEAVFSYIEEIVNSLGDNVRVHVDSTDKRPGWKQNYWETQGVPVKLEVGPRDAKNRCVIAVRRDKLHLGKEGKVKLEFDGLNDSINNMLEDMHQSLLAKATEQLENAVVKVGSWVEFVEAVDNKKLCLTAFCNQTECEEAIKEETSAKSLCIPTDENFVMDVSGMECIKCGISAQTHCLFGKSY